MALVHPNLPDELREKRPEMHDLLSNMWTRDTHCVHCSEMIGARMSFRVPLCLECQERPIILDQYKK